MVEALPLLSVAVSTVSPPSATASPPNGTNMSDHMSAWPAYNDSSRPNSPAESVDADVEMAPTPSRVGGFHVQVPARGHARQTSSLSESTMATSCLSPVWGNALEHVPIITVDLNSSRNSSSGVGGAGHELASAERQSRWKWGGGKKDGGKKEKKTARPMVQQRMVADDDELW